MGLPLTHGWRHTVRSTPGSLSCLLGFVYMSYPDALPILAHFFPIHLRLVLRTAPSRQKYCSPISPHLSTTVPMENKWAVPPTDPQPRHDVVQKIPLLRLQVLMSPYAPDPTYCRPSWPRFPTKRAYVPTGRRTHHPELHLCALFR